MTVTLTFYGGLRGRFSFHVSSAIVDPTDPVILGLITVLDGVTRGKAVHIEISLQAAIASTAASGVPYVSEDKAFFRFRDDTGTPHNFKVMGPKTTIFESANTEVVDLTNADVIDFTDAMTTYARGRGGDVISVIINGYRKENRKRTKGGRATA